MKLSHLVLIILFLFLFSFLLQEVSYNLHEVPLSNGYTLVIPKINLSVPINSDDLNRGPLMDNKSGIPGKSAVYVFGHRLSFNNVFMRINELDEGDNVSITGFNIGCVNYKVDSVYIVNPSYIIPIKNETTLYLVSCYAGVSRRIIIECHLT